MEAKVFTIEFRAGFNGARIDFAEGVIRGVSVITADIQARGHDLWTDGTTLLQMKQCAERKGGRIPVKENHKSGVEAVCGYLTNFEVDGSRLRADFYLLKSHPRREQYLEAASRMPEGLGLSAAFEPPTKDDMVNGRKMARCEDLLAVDLVTMPAANPNGMFSAKTVDTNLSAMSATNNPQTPQTVEQMLAALTSTVAELKSSLEAISSRVDGLQPQEQEQDGEPLSIEEIQALAQMDDAQLKELGLTREEVDAAVEAAISAMNEQADESQGEEQAAPAAAGAEAAAPAAVGAGASATGLEALQKQVTELRAKMDAKDAAEKEQAVETMLSSIEAAAKTLTDENAALRTQLEKRSGKPASSGSRAAIGFEKGGSAKPESFEGKVELLMSQGKARNVAVLETIRQFPELHRQWRADSQGSRVTNL
jgi:hypothetical protein